MSRRGSSTLIREDVIAHEPLRRDHRVRRQAPKRAPVSFLEPSRRDVRLERGSLRDGNHARKRSQRVHARDARRLSSCLA